VRLRGADQVDRRGRRPYNALFECGGGVCLPFDKGGLSASLWGIPNRIAIYCNVRNYYYSLPIKKFIAFVR